MTTIPVRADNPRIKARATTYAGIKMRSRLEADYARHLDATKQTWTYEPHCFAGPHGQWLPDFGLRSGGQLAYLEVKPAGMYDDDGHDDSWHDLSEIMRQMEVVWASQPKALLILVLWEYGGPALAEFYGWYGESWQVTMGGRLTVPVELKA